MKYTSKRLAALGLVLPVLCIGSAVQAADMPQCSVFDADLHTVRASLVDAEDGLATLQHDTNRVRRYLEIPEDIRDEIHEIDQTIKFIHGIIGDLAALTTLVPAVGEPVKNVSMVLQNIRADVVKPADTFVTDIDKVLEIKRLTKSLDALSATLAEVREPLHELNPPVNEAIKGTGQLMKAAQDLPDGTCKQDAEAKLDTFCGGLDGGVHPMTITMANIDRSVKQAVHQAHAVVDPAFAPLHKIRTVVRKLKHDMAPIRRDIKKIKKALNKEIKIGPVHFTVHHILKNWHKIVNDVEKYLGIKKAEKWLQRQIAHLIHPLILGLENSIKGMAKGVSFNGFHVADAKRDLAELERRYARIQSDYTREKASLESAAKAIDGYTVDACQ